MCIWDFIVSGTKGGAGISWFLKWKNWGGGGGSLKSSLLPNVSFWTRYINKWKIFFYILCEIIALEKDEERKRHVRFVL